MRGSISAARSLGGSLSRPADDTSVCGRCFSCLQTLLFRPRRRIARMGVDSLAVLTVYGLGMIGLFTVSNMG